jgi:ABC-type uncharacterized transport system permease subunit
LCAQPVGSESALLLRTLGYCALALGAQLRLIIFQALLRLLALLTLAQLLELCFASLSHLAVYFTTLGIRLTADACHEGGYEGE